MLNIPQQAWEKIFDDAMQAFVSTWEDNNETDTNRISGFIAASSIYAFFEKFELKHPDMEHAATLLNQAANQLGLEEKF